MQILISCAKSMTGTTTLPASHITQPCFAKEAESAVHELMQVSADELGTMLRVNRALAIENKQRFEEFFSAQPLPAMWAYTGVVFKHISPKKLSEDALQFAQNHLFITSFLYGLLRPFDGIRPYRMEGDMRLKKDEGSTRFEYWRPRLTDLLIDTVKADDGILVNLASAEMKNLFFWQRVKKELRIITPTFMVEKNGRMRTIVVYAKMCRGEMARYLLTHPIHGRPQELAHFSFQGFDFAGFDGENPVYILKG